MASGLRGRSDMEGVYKQMHNASSGDLLWGGEKARGIKRKASSQFFPVERLISKRTVRNTVGLLLQ